MTGLWVALALSCWVLAAHAGRVSARADAGLVPARAAVLWCGAAVACCAGSVVAAFASGLS